MSTAQDSLSSSQKRPPSILVNSSNKDQSFRGSTINLKQVKFNIEPRCSSRARLERPQGQTKKIDEILNEIAEKINEKNKIKYLLKLSKNISNNTETKKKVNSQEQNERFLTEFDQKYKHFLIEQETISRSDRHTKNSPSTGEFSKYSAVESTDNTATISKTTTYNSSKDGTNSPTSKRTSTPSVDNSTSAQSKRIISPSIEISNISVTGTMYQFNNDNERTLTSFMDKSLDKESPTLSAKNDVNATLDFTETEDDEDESALNATRSLVSAKNSDIYSNRELSSSTSSSSLFFGNEAVKKSNTPPLALSYIPAQLINNNNLQGSHKKVSSIRGKDYSNQNLGLVKELTHSFFSGARISTPALKKETNRVKVNTNSTKRPLIRTTPPIRSNTLPNRQCKSSLQRCNSLSTTKMSESNQTSNQSKQINNDNQSKHNSNHHHQRHHHLNKIQNNNHKKEKNSECKSSIKISIPIYDSNANRYLDNSGRASRKPVSITKNSKNTCIKKVQTKSPNILNSISQSINTYENNERIFKGIKKTRQINNTTDSVNKSISSGNTNNNYTNNDNTLYVNDDIQNEANTLYINEGTNIKENLYTNDNITGSNIYINTVNSNNNNLYMNNQKSVSKNLNSPIRNNITKRFSSCDIGDSRKTFHNITNPSIDTSLYINEKFNNDPNFYENGNQKDYANRTCRKKVFVSRYQEILRNTPILEENYNKASTYNTITAAQIIKSRLIKPKISNNNESNDIKFMTHRPPNITTFKLEPFGLKKICKKGLCNTNFRINS